MRKILRYIKSRVNLGLCSSVNDETYFGRYSALAWVRDVRDRNLTNNYGLMIEGSPFNLCSGTSCGGLVRLESGVHYYKGHMQRGIMDNQQLQLQLTAHPSLGQSCNVTAVVQFNYQGQRE